MSNVIPFKFSTSDVRVVERDGDPWFVAKDVSEILGYPSAPQMTRILDDDEKGMHTLGGDQELSIISESGLFHAALKSRKPEAKPFRKWVTSEVLPSVRKTGGYGQQAVDFNNPAQLRGFLLQATEEIEKRDQHIAVLEPKAVALDRLSGSDGSLCITNAAKDLQMRPKDMFAYLSQNSWIYKRAGSASWTAYQEKIQQGLLEHKTTTVSRSDGSEKLIEQVRVTSKGLAKLASLLGKSRAA
tara:strand:+ start:2176 stop:2901 length:726 start_codon:yes stop_codon:yes gene_type:complete